MNSFQVKTNGFVSRQGEKLPVEVQLYRTPSKDWVVATNVINGVCEGDSWHFATKKDALKMFNRLGSKVAT